jgi:hypothetical protein
MGVLHTTWSSTRKGLKDLVISEICKASSADVADDGDISARLLAAVNKPPSSSSTGAAAKPKANELKIDIDSLLASKSVKDVLTEVAGNQGIAACMATFSGRLNIPTARINKASAFRCLQLPCVTA